MKFSNPRKIAILDVGSTTAKWYFVNNNGDCETLTSEGFNPTYQDKVPDGFFTDSIRKLLKEIDRVVYYGTGVISQQAVKVVKNIFQPYHIRSIEVYSDILGAARACCNDKVGIVAILGTGSNAIYFDGSDVHVGIPSMGYIIGDHGSGSYIGKKLLEFYFTRQMPEDIARIFEVEFDLSRSVVLQEVYSDTGAKYLAGFAPFLNSGIQHEWIDQFITEILKTFINIYLVPLVSSENIPIHFVGSIAYNFRNLLSDIIKEKGLVLGKVLETPGLELVNYHTNII